MIIALLIGLTACSDTPVDNMHTSKTDFVDSDVPLGDPEAPVTLIEYASLTCSHCRSFHKSVLPQLKSEFIDTGKVRLILREFPTSPLALSRAQAMLVRCAGREHFHDLISTFFDRQYDIIEAAQTIGALNMLTEIAAGYGLDQAAVSACLENQELRTSIDAIIAEAQARGVRSTPTLFINDKRVSAADTKLVGLRALIHEALGETAPDNRAN